MNPLTQPSIGGQRKGRRGAPDGGPLGSDMPTISAFGAVDLAGKPAKNGNAGELVVLSGVPRSEDRPTPCPLQLYRRRLPLASPGAVPSSRAGYLARQFHRKKKRARRRPAGSGRGIPPPAVEAPRPVGAVRVVKTLPASAGFSRATRRWLIPSRGLRPGSSMARRPCVGDQKSRQSHPPDLKDRNGCRFACGGLLASPTGDAGRKPAVRANPCCRRP